MAGTKKRKARKKLSKKFDISKPITQEMLFEQIGTANDPCFGKLLDLKNPTCRMCGDSEICSIQMSIKTQVKRAKIESEREMKDLHQADTDYLTFISEKIREAGKTRMLLSKAAKAIRDELLSGSSDSLDEITSDIKDQVKRKKTMTILDKEGKTYIKL